MNAKEKPVNRRQHMRQIADENLTAREVLLSAGNNPDSSLAASSLDDTTRYEDCLASSDPSCVTISTHKIIQQQNVFELYFLNLRYLTFQ